MNWRRLWPEPLYAIRLMFALAGVLMTAPLANPNADLFAQYHSYYAWQHFGSARWWAWRAGAVAALELLALLPLGRVTYYIRISSSLSQGVWYLILGTMFAMTHPPQTGVTYFAPALMAFYLAAETVRNGR